MRQSDKINQIILVFILLVAASLRFYHFFDLPFMWDELSAWSRLHFDSFSELINQGVKPDGHPAGVQVFLYYWTHWFGDQEWVVKLPFNLMGLASVWLIYKIGSIWFSEKSGLIAAAFSATLQFFVLYSPVARPYSSGLFLSLMMVLFWSLYMFRTPKRIYLAGFIVFAALSAYNHHFSLLFAAIVGFSGLIIIPKNLLKEYLLSGVLIFALYIPHLPIFFHQLGIGGIGGEGLWLEKPDWSFITEFFKWSFQFSIINYILIGVFFVLSLLYCRRNCFYQKNIKILLLIIWFSFPLLIGLGYSIYIKPVIQYSMLIFSFPYFLLLISIFADKIPKSAFILVIIGILSINIYQLVFKRHHYKIIEKQPFEITAELAEKYSESAFVLFNTIPEYQEYYFKKHHIPHIPNLSIYDQGINDRKIDSVLKSRDENNIVCCGLPLEFENIIQRYYPYFIKKEDAYTMECYVFSKTKPEIIQEFSEEVYFTDFSQINKHWKVDQSRITEDSLLQKYYEFKPEQKWGFTLIDSLKNYPENAILDFTAVISSENKTIAPLWVFSAHIGKKQVFWRGDKLELLEASNHTQQEVYFSIDTQWLPTNTNRDSIEWRLYFWNKEQNSFKIKSLTVSYREANPFKYSLFSKIH